MDHHPAIADRVAGVVVTAAADRDLKPAAAREADRLRDLLGRGAARNHRGLAVDGSVPDRARSVVVRVTRRQCLAAEGRSECLNSGIRVARHVHTPISQPPLVSGGKSADSAQTIAVTWHERSVDGPERSLRSDKDDGCGTCESPIQFMPTWSSFRRWEGRPRRSDTRTTGGRAIFRGSAGCAAPGPSVSGECRTADSGRRSSRRIGWPRPSIARPR